MAVLQELQIAGINFKAFDLGGHEIARRVWKDYYAKVWAQFFDGLPCPPMSLAHVDPAVGGRNSVPCGRPG